MLNLYIGYNLQYCNNFHYKITCIFQFTHYRLSPCTSKVQFQNQDAVCILYSGVNFRRGQTQLGIYNKHTYLKLNFGHNFWTMFRSLTKGPAWNIRRLISYFWKICYRFGPQQENCSSLIRSASFFSPVTEGKVWSVLICFSRNG